MANRHGELKDFTNLQKIKVNATKWIVRVIYKDGQRDDFIFPNEIAASTEANLLRDCYKRQLTGKFWEHPIYGWGNPDKNPALIPDPELEQRTKPRGQFKGKKKKTNTDAGALGD